jgi:iron complex outermembrane recepter protein
MMLKMAGYATFRFVVTSILALCIAASAEAAAPYQQLEQTEPLEPIEVTATRIPEPVDRVPAYITVIRGSELRARGVTDLRGAVALVAGVEAPPGGDTGPAGAVPSFWGLHEFDAFLLVVDGVPWGGAFNPAIPTLNLTNVERIEILKGSAPVIYGATSFVGVIQVIHYPAGEAAKEAQMGFGSYGSIRGSASVVLNPIGDFQQSIAVDGQKLHYSDARESIEGGHVLYRGAGSVAGGTLRVDGDIAVQRQVPPSPVVRQGGVLTTLTPLDANYNPADARINEDRYHMVLGYSHATPLGLWETTGSVAYSDINDIRGFLRPSLIDDGSPNADSQNQHRTILDTYFDTHISTNLAEALHLVYGIDWLYGLGKQTSRNGEYYAPLNGTTTPPKTTDLHVDEINSISDRRSFVGQYAQIDWKPDDRWDLLAGIRLNETNETLSSSHVDGFDPTADLSATSTKNETRLAGTFGVSYRTWKSGFDETVVFANYKNAFKPAAIDFGPDYRPDVLNPETAKSYEAGVKGALMGGRLDYQAGVFLLDFKNLVVTTTDTMGNPLVQNAGGERLKGIEVEARYHAAADVTLVANISYHDARFTQFIAVEGGANVDAGGNQLTMSPHLLGAVGIIYSPAVGLNGSVVANYVGRRYLDIANTALTPSYTTVDVTAGYRWPRFSITLAGYNLSDKRPPVSASEFGDQSYYLLPGRTLFVNFGAPF